MIFLDKSYYWKDGMYGPEYILALMATLFVVLTFIPFVIILTKYLFIIRKKLTVVMWNWKFILLLLPCFVAGIVCVIAIIILYKAGTYFKVDQKDSLIPTFRNVTIGMMCTALVCCLINLYLLHIGGRNLLFSYNENQIILFSFHFNRNGSDVVEISNLENKIEFKWKTKKDKEKSMSVNTKSWIGKKISETLLK